jgi:Ca-activated chloride channel homolog
MTLARLRIALLAVAVLVVSMTPTAAAPPAGVTEGTLLWRSAAQTALVAAPLLETDVEIRVTGPVARASVRQAFTNPSGDWVEGVYVFPLPEDAAVDHLRMRVDDRVIEGVIRERVAARATYEKARQEGTRASLVEQERPNVFTTSLANIPPGASITVEIEYQQLVRYDEGRYHLRFPMVVAPRYMPGAPLAPPPAGTGWSPDTDAVPDASRISPPVRHPSRGPINPVHLRVDLAPGVALAEVTSPYHPIRVTPTPDGRHEIVLAQGPVPADRDFELVWQPSAAAPAAAMFIERAGPDVFALLTVVPPRPETVSGPRVARELIFVIDTSGSMAGASIDQARTALALALGRLAPTDTFNVIRFNHRTDSLFAGAQPADAANVELARRYVSGLRADGGTEMLPALVAALDGREHGDRLRQVIFLTDGAVGNEERLFDAIRARLGDSRLFTIGIGSAPNGHFMREAARFGRGTFTSIGSVREVQAKMDALFRKIEAPALTDLRLELAGAAQVEMVPDHLPDLYLGEPIVVALKAPSLPSRGVLRGRLGDTEWRQEIVLRAAGESPGIGVQWARARIAALLDGGRPGADEAAVRDAVIEVALRHHLVTRHTSLVAVDVTPARPADAGLRTHALETNLPADWDYAAVFGLGQGATAASLHLLGGAVALLFVTGFYVALRYERVHARGPRR